MQDPIFNFKKIYFCFVYNGYKVQVQERTANGDSYFALVKGKQDEVKSPEPNRELLIGVEIKNYQIIPIFCEIHARNAGVEIPIQLKLEAEGLEPPDAHLRVLLVLQVAGCYYILLVV